jgi:hypothetical protein
LPTVASPITLQPVDESPGVGLSLAAVAVAGIGSSVVGVFWSAGVAGYGFSKTVFVLTSLAGALIGAVALRWFLSTVSYEISF